MRRAIRARHTVWKYSFLQPATTDVIVNSQTVKRQAYGEIIHGDAISWLDLTVQLDDNYF